MTIADIRNPWLRRPLVVVAAILVGVVLGALAMVTAVIQAGRELDDAFRGSDGIAPHLKAAWRGPK